MVSISTEWPLRCASYNVRLTSLQRIINCGSAEVVYLEIQKGATPTLPKLTRNGSLVCVSWTRFMNMNISLSQLTRQPSLEVAPTTLAHKTRQTAKNTSLVTYIRSRRRNIFSSSDRELWPVSDFALQKWPRHCQGKPSYQISIGQKSFTSKVIIRIHSKMKYLFI